MLSDERMKTIYIASPFRAETAWEIENNIREAERWGLVVARLGAIPVIPHAMYRFFHGSLPDAFWIEATLTVCRYCDSLLTVDYRESDRWRTSTGTCGEIDEMKRLHRPTFFLGDLVDGTIADWIKEGT